jgi:putative endonuclease
MSDTVSKGRYGETLAKKYLLEQGYEILSSHWQKRVGEIDIIVRDHASQEIVFVEVKLLSRASVNQFGYPEEKVKKDKLSKIYKTAQWYLLKNYPPTQVWRIDVISLVVEGNAQQAELTHFKNVSL